MLVDSRQNSSGEVILGLSECPQARQIGVGLHGHRPVETYRMLGFWCVHLYTYRARVRANGQWYEIRPGSASVFPPDADMEYHFAGRCEHVYAHFFVPAGANRVGEVVPMMQDVGPRFDQLNDALREAVGWFPNHARRAEVRLWDVLWELSRATSTGTNGDRSAGVVDVVCRAIEMRLAEPLRISTLIESLSLDVSHNHLLRLFRERTGTSLLDYVHRRRVDRATHLLRHTTLPIKAIAHQVGISDLQLFNKTVRRFAGVSPRAVRDGWRNDFDETLAPPRGASRGRRFL